MARLVVFGVVREVAFLLHHLEKCCGTNVDFSAVFFGSLSIATINFQSNTLITNHAEGCFLIKNTPKNRWFKKA